MVTVKGGHLFIIKIPKYCYYTMKVLDPNNTTHTISFVARKEIFEVVTLEIYNEFTNELTTTSISVIDDEIYCQDGYTFLTFALVCAEGDEYSIKLYSATEVYYRGKLFVTAQTPQEFKLNNSTYLYDDEV